MNAPYARRKICKFGFRCYGFGPPDSAMARYAGTTHELTPAQEAWVKARFK